MRLDPQESKALQKAISDVEDPVYLFGSRVDESARGGDIDVLILSEKSPLQLSREVSVAFNMECEEKIDVVVIPKNNRNEEQEAFLNTIKMERIK